MILNNDQFTVQEKVKIAQNRDNIISWIKENICEKLGENDRISVKFIPKYSNKDLPRSLIVYHNGNIKLKINNYTEDLENRSAIDILNIMAEWQNIKHSLINQVEALQEVRDSIDDFTI